MNTKPLALALAFIFPSLGMSENTANEMSLLRGRLEKQMTEILALDAEIQSLSHRLGREGTPLPRREPDRPAPEPSPLPAVHPSPLPTPNPVQAPAPNPPVEVRPAVPVEEGAPSTNPVPPLPPPTPPVPDVASNPAPLPPMPIPTPTSPPVAPVAPPIAPVVDIRPPSPPPPSPIPPAPPVERQPRPVAPTITTGGEVVVQPGDTLSAIARRNKTTVAELMKLNPGLVPEKLRLGQKIKLKASATSVASTGGSSTQNRPSPAPSAPGSYVIQSGDTMHSIARRSGTTVEALCRLNNITNPSTIQIGMRIKLPDGSTVAPPEASGQPSEPVKPRPPTPVTHIVKPGDTLSSISRQTGTPIEELRKVNNLKDDIIHPGQSLKVRRGTAGGAEAPAARPNNNGASARPAPATAPQGVEMAEYTVHTGDSIFSISKRYFLSREEVAAMNSLPVDAPLREGQKIRLPASAMIATQLTETESHKN